MLIWFIFSVGGWLVTSFGLAPVRFDRPSARTFTLKTQFPIRFLSSRANAREALSAVFGACLEDRGRLRYSVRVKPRPNVYGTPSKQDDTHGESLYPVCAWTGVLKDRRAFTGHNKAEVAGGTVVETIAT